MATTMSEKHYDKRKRPTPDEQRSRIQSVPVVSLGVPFVSSTKYAQREIAIRLDLPQATILRGVMEALEVRHAQLNSGAVVQSAHDALRWMLEEVARGAG